MAFEAKLSYKIDKKLVLKYFKRKQVKEEVILKGISGTGDTLILKIPTEQFDYVVTEAILTLKEHYTHPFSPPMIYPCFRALEAALEFVQLSRKGAVGGAHTLTDLVSYVLKGQKSPSEIITNYADFLRRHEEIGKSRIFQTKSKIIKL